MATTSIYNLLCRNCNHSWFRHMRESEQERAAVGQSYDDATGPCHGDGTSCSCTQFMAKPATDRGVSLRPSRNDIGFHRALRDIGEMLDDSSGPDGDSIWEFARDTLEGIRDTVQRSGTCTDAQRGAIDNIREGGERGSGHHGRRSRWD